MSIFLNASGSELRSSGSGVRPEFPDDFDVCDSFMGSALLWSQTLQVSSARFGWREDRPILLAGASRPLFLGKVSRPPGSFPSQEKASVNRTIFLQSETIYTE